MGRERQLWLVPVGVAAAAALLVATFALLDPGAAFVVVAMAVVVGLGAAPVVLGVLSRRADPLHEDNQLQEEWDKGEQ